jgi:predicted membrane-bound spermidine synthase
MSERGAIQERIDWWIVPAFFTSGFAALVYQVVWQRVLFASFGINIEAVTIVVTAFLAGLGVGSLAGGRISTRNEGTLLAAFAIVEASIGAYGLVSVRLFRWTAEFAASLSAWETGALSFVFVLIPTFLMGITLPLLVSYAVRKNASVGLSVGRLYFINTAGSSLASLMSAAFIMRDFGESRSVLLAESLNLLVAAFVFSAWLRERSG